MPISVKCQDCGKAFKVKDEAAGKRMKCPGCGSILAIPKADEEAIQEAAPPPKPAAAVRKGPAPPPRRPAPEKEDEDDEAPAPRHKARAAEAEDEPPRRRKQTPAKSSVGMKVAQGAFVVALCLGALAVWWFFFRERVPDLKTFTSKEGAFEVLLPGEPKPMTQVAGPVTVNLFKCDYSSLGQLYLASYSDIPPELIKAGPHGQVEAELEVLMNMEKGVRSKGRKDAWQVSPGLIAAQITVESDKGTLRARALMFKQRLFVIVARTPSDSSYEAYVQKIYDSFKIVGDVPDVRPKGSTGGFGGHTEDIEGIAISAKGDMVATVGRDGNLIVSEYPGGKQIALVSVKDEFRTPNSVAFSPDGETLAIGLGGPVEKLILWDLATKSEKAKVEAPGSADGLHFSGDGKWILMSSRGQIYRFDAKALGKAEEVGEGERAVVTADGKIFAVRDQELRLFDQLKGRQKEPAGWPAGGGRITALALGGEEGLLAVARGDKVSFLDAKKLEAIKGKDLRVAFGAELLALSPKGDLLAVAERGGWAVYALPGGGLLEKKEEGPVSRLLFAPDGKLVVARGTFVDIRDMAGKEPIKEPEKEKEKGKEDMPPVKSDKHTENIDGLAVSWKSDRLATVGRDGTLRIWEFPSGKPIAVADLKDEYRTPNSVAFSPDGELLAVGLGGPLEKLIFWDLPSRSVKTKIEAPGSADTLRFSADGKWLMFGPRNNILRYDPKAPGKGEPVARGNQAQLFGAKTIYASWSKQVKILDLEKGEKKKDKAPGPVFAEDVLRLALSGDGKWLAVALRKEILLFETAKAAVLPDVKLTPGFVDQFTLSAKGDLLAMRNDSGWQLISLPDGKVIEKGEGVSRLLFAPDDRLVLVRGRDFEIRGVGGKKE